MIITNITVETFEGSQKLIDFISRKVLMALGFGRVLAVALRSKLIASL